MIEGVTGKGQLRFFWNDETVRCPDCSNFLDLHVSKFILIFCHLKSTLLYGIFLEGSTGV
jgi:hypothetical protein